MDSMQGHEMKKLIECSIALYIMEMSSLNISMHGELDLDEIPASPHYLGHFVTQRRLAVIMIC